jgi:hypothetical protein
MDAPAFDIRVVVGTGIVSAMMFGKAVCRDRPEQHQDNDYGGKDSSDSHLAISSITH